MYEQKEKLARLAHVFEKEEMPEAARLARTALRKVSRDEIWVAVCGHFSAGKSTLLNDWLGDGFLPTSPIPTSANIVTLRGGEASASVAINETEWIELDEASLMHISDYCKVEEIKEIEYTLHPFPFDNHVVLMDTPGIDSTDERHRQATERSLFLADHLFFMMDYNHVQSDQNIQLMKQFSQEGRPYSIIINQIDKHDENELSFDSFKQTLQKSFAHHSIDPDETFYISLRDDKHPHNEVERLRDYVKRVIGDVEDKQTERAEALIETLRERSKQSVERSLEQLPTYDSNPKEMQSRLNRLERVRAWLTSFRREFFKHQTPIIDSAPIMNYEFRELLRDYLESSSPTFKVGLFFSKEKTRQERERREDIACKEFNRLIDMNLRPHLIKYAEDIVRDLDLPESLLPNADVLPIAPVSLIKDQVKTGASLSGDTVLQFSRDIESALSTWITKMSEHWVVQVESVLATESSTRLKECSSEEEELFDALDTLALRERLNNRLDALQHAEELNLSPEDILRLERRDYVEINQLPQAPVADSEKELASTSFFDDAIDSELFNFSNEYAVCEILQNHPLFRSRVASLRRKIERAEHEQFTLAVFGAFSAGKSSTLNALFGESVLPTSPNPLTASITKIVPPNGRPNKTAQITFKSESELDEELQAHGATLRSLQTDDPFVNAVRQAPLSYLGKTETVDYETFCAFVADETKSCIVKEVELYLDSQWADQGIVFVDTPGADSQFNRHSEVQFGYMRDADAVLFVTYYNHAFTEADRELVIQLGRVQGTGDHEMFFLVNASDLAKDDEEVTSVTTYVSHQLTKLGVKNPTVLPISSRDAMRDGDAGFDRFVSTLEHYVNHDLRQANAVRIKQETARLIESFDRVLREAKEDEALKEARRDQLLKLIETPPRLEVSSFVDGFGREARELLAHLETRTLLRLSDFVKETFHPVEVDGSKNSLELALKRTLDKYGYDVHQELQVFQYRLERFLNRELALTIERASTKVADVLPTLDFEASLNTEWLRQTVTSPQFDLKLFRPVLKHYKNASQFFEGDGRTRLKDELTALLRSSIRQHLEQVALKELQLAKEQLELSDDKVNDEWLVQLSELAEAELSLLSDSHAFDEMAVRITNIRSRSSVTP